MLTFMLVSGYYVRGVPVWIGWLRYLSFTYWGFNREWRSSAPLWGREASPWG